MKPARVERIEILHPPDLPGIMTVGVKNCGQHFRWFHETYSVATMIDGSGIFRCDRRMYDSGPGGIACWQPGDFHAVTRYGPDSRGEPLAEQRLVTIDPALVEKAAETLDVPRAGLNLRSRMETAAPAYRAFRAFHRSLETPTTRLEKESRLARCLEILIRRVFEGSGRAAEVGDEREATRRARSLIIERAAEPLRLDDLAAEAGLDKFRLVRAFTRQIGVPPHQFQLAVRVARARTLLARRRSAAEVAAALGFADQSHFIRVFRKQTGFTPGAFAP